MTTQTRNVIPQAGILAVDDHAVLLGAPLPVDAGLSGSPRGEARGLAAGPGHLALLLAVVQTDPEPAHGRCRRRQLVADGRQVVVLGLVRDGDQLGAVLLAAARSLLPCLAGDQEVVAVSPAGEPGGRALDDDRGRRDLVSAWLDLWAFHQRARTFDTLWA